MNYTPLLALMLLLAACSKNENNSNNINNNFCHPKQITGYDANGNVTSRFVYHFSNGRLDSTTMYNGSNVYDGVVKYEYNGNVRWGTSVNASGVIVGKAKEVLDNGYTIQFERYDVSGTILQGRSVSQYNCPN